MPVLLEDAIKQTQITLKPIFSKPKCTAKLLTKPPFRFIHDIITATMAATEFPKNYFSPHELGSKNLKDKASKVAFLDKLIYLVGVCHGKEVDVRPSKVVAGLEPINTNILLTLFGKAAVDPNLDHTAAIKHCQFGGRIGDFSRSRKVHSRPDNDKDKEEEKKSDLGDEMANSSHEDAQNDYGNVGEGRETIEGDENSPTPAPQPPISQHMSESKNDDEIVVSSREEKQQSSPITLLQNEVRQCNSDPLTTKNIMSSIVTKPKCTEKLLKKPPFRFLHDLIMAVNNVAGLGLEKLYTDDEMDSSKVKSKDAKIRFLEKICEYVGDQLSEEVNLKPNKVVAGLEAEKTCHFLQLFAIVASNALSKQKSNSTKEVSSPTTQLENNKAAFDISSQSKEGGVNCTDLEEKESKDDPPEQKDEIEEGPSHEQKDETKEEQSNDVTNSLNNEEEEDMQSFTAVTKDDFSEQTPLPNSSRNVNSTDNKGIEHQNLPKESKDDKSDELPSKLEFNSGSPDRKKREAQELEEKKMSIEHVFFGTDDFQEETIADEAKLSVRPKTARRRPPRIKERTPSAEKKNTVKVGRPIIFKDEDDDKFNGEISTSTEKETKSERDSSPNKDNVNSMKLHLHVRKRQGDNGIISSLDTMAEKATPYDLQSISQSIQCIARAATPIGRVMDYLPTEINSMMKERDYWRDEYERQEKELVKMKKKSEIELRPLQSQIRSTEDEIDHLKALLLKTKAQIGQNEEWIKSHMKRICCL